MKQQKETALFQLHFNNHCNSSPQKEDKRKSVQLTGYCLKSLREYHLLQCTAQAQWKYTHLIQALHSFVSIFKPSLLLSRNIFLQSKLIYMRLVKKAEVNFGLPESHFCHPRPSDHMYLLVDPHDPLHCCRGDLQIYLYYFVAP